MTAKPKDTDVLLTLEQLCFSYESEKTKKNAGMPFLQDISFEIARGEFLCLLGPSGCGKTTLLRLIAGLEKADSGALMMTNVATKSEACANIGVDDTPKTSLRLQKNKLKRTAPKIGMVFQDLALFPHMSAARNIGYALRHLSRPERRARVDEMLELVGLTDKRGSYPHELSGGQKQRLALARALARKPDLILLDEPFAAQDMRLRAQIRDDVMHILRAAGIAALLVTHDSEEAMQFADRIAIMNEGKIVQIGSPVDVYNAPQNNFVASFFGQVNVLKGFVDNGGITTPIGFVPTPDIEEQAFVDVIVRHEAIKLRKHDPSINHHDPQSAHVHGHILERKYLGRSTLVHIDTCSIEKADNDIATDVVHLHARMPGAFVNKVQDVQDIYLDYSQIFVFRSNK